MYLHRETSVGVNGLRMFCLIKGLPFEGSVFRTKRMGMKNTQNLSYVNGMVTSPSANQSVTLTSKIGNASEQLYILVFFIMVHFLK